MATPQSMATPAKPNPGELLDRPEYLTSEFLQGERLPCTATNKRGLPCEKNAIPGGNVCIYHGGQWPHVRAKAARRYELIADLAQERIVERLINDEVDDPRAILAILDTATKNQQLLEGGATSRTETQVLQRREELKMEIRGKLDDLAEAEHRKAALKEELGI